MGKKSGTSWLTLVKRAFRSPTKENEKKGSRRREEHEQDEEEKKREKRRWLFRKSSNHIHQAQQCKTKTIATETSANSNTTAIGTATLVSPIFGAEQRHAIAVAAATAAAAEAAAVTAQAAVEIVRLTRPNSSFKFREKWAAAAIVIQTAFRGYLARRALRALKGLVKLQALVRGHNVRKQAKLTLQCMQALARVQDRVRNQRARFSHEGSRRSMFVEINSLWDCRPFQDIKERKSTSRDVSSALDEWDERPRVSEGIDESRKEAALKREKALAYALSSQIWRSQRNQSAGDEKEMEERTRWLDRWMATKQWESSSNGGGGPAERRDTNIKTVEIDTSRPFLYSSSVAARRSHYENHHHQIKQPTTPQHSNIACPFHRQSHGHSIHQSPITPSPCRTRPLQVRSASPRCIKEERCHSAAHTPTLGSSRYGMSRYGMGVGGGSTMPNYMAATESAKARVRSQSAPRQRPSTPERERGGAGTAAKKRLSYPAPPPEPPVYSSYSQNLRSPSLKSMPGGHFGLEQRSNCSLCYTESIGGEISPCSTTDLRWLKEAKISYI